MGLRPDDLGRPRGEANGRVLDAWYPGARARPAAQCSRSPARTLRRSPAARRTRAIGACGWTSRVCEIDLDPPPAGTEDAYLRLHLLSHRLVRPERDQPGRHLRRAAERRVDQRRPVRGGGLRPDQGRAAPQGSGPGRRRGQVPADDRLRGPHRGAHRRRIPGPVGRPPRARHDRHARGFRQLQRGDARLVDGRGPHLGRRRGRRRLRRRRRRLDHGHPVRRRQGAHQRRPALPDRRERGHRHLAR